MPAFLKGSGDRAAHTALRAEKKIARLAVKRLKKPRMGALNAARCTACMAAIGLIAYERYTIASNLRARLPQ